MTFQYYPEFGLENVLTKKGKKETGGALERVVGEREYKKRKRNHKIEILFY